MPTPNTMTRNPALIPPKGGVYAAVDHKNKKVHVSYSAQMQYRSYVLAKELKKMSCSCLGVAPDQDPQPQFEFVVVTEMGNRDRGAIEDEVFAVREAFKAQGYSILNSKRAIAPQLEIDDRMFTLNGALEYASHLASLGTAAGAAPSYAGKIPSYNTAYQRLEKGMTARQVVGLDPLPPRWGRKNKIDDTRTSDPDAGHSK